MVILKDWDATSAGRLSISGGKRPTPMLMLASTQTDRNLVRTKEKEIWLDCLLHMYLTRKMH